MAKKPPSYAQLGGLLLQYTHNIEDERNGLIDAHTGELSVPAGLLSSQSVVIAENPKVTD